ncbi:SDR family oxidoreductase [Actinocorallia sp. A-T 12471]|uniref:SDR family oxidoreductase n=1 Tax=Actinocorallia sp. A-T 12471 TaxID=3089813 RepID=UPI0029D16EFE|nr:SDR family oxidoreductase [Actinocorallia sp. A-T 12471]MDX6743330.1 SDR family oxidoreductase [Actinocorallia sp. A-T 12471]
MIGVTGATGNVGGKTARLLADAGEPTRLLVRDASRAPELPDAEVVGGCDYADAKALTEAFAGVTTLFLVSAKEAADRVAQHRTAVDAAREAGVRHLVYLSFLAAGPDATFTFARDHHATEQYIKASGLDFTFLRPSLYLEALVGFPIDGVIKGPAGQGRCAFVAQDDVAAVAASVLRAPDVHRGRKYDITGPEAVSLATAARLLGVRYVDETIEDAYASRDVYGAPEWEVEGWVTSYQAIATGEMSAVSPTVERATGRAPIGLARFLAERG